MKPRTKPSSGSKVIVGTKPIWELWAETHIAKIGRGEELLRLGCFTVNDFMKKAPKTWTRDKCAAHLVASGLKHEVAIDPRVSNGLRVSFYFPPGIDP